MALIDKAARAFRDAGGAVMPLMKTKFGSTITQAVTTSAGAATQVHNGTSGPKPVRIWAVGSDCAYIFGASGVAAPAGVDGYVGKDSYQETWMEEAETHIRLKAVTGAGTVIVETLI